MGKQNLLMAENADTMRDIVDERARIKEKSLKYAEKQIKVAFTWDNFGEFFPQNSIMTPAGQVMVYKEQFIKLGERDRGKRKILLGAMYQTLKDPVFIFNDDDKPLKKLYVKSFENEGNVVLTVTKKKNGRNISVSTHPKDVNNILSKINGPDAVFYEKDNTMAEPAGKTSKERGGNED